MALQVVFYYAPFVGVGTTKDLRRCPVWDYVPSKPRTGEGWYDLVGPPQGPLGLGYAIGEAVSHDAMATDARITVLSGRLVHDVNGLGLNGWLQQPFSTAPGLRTRLQASGVPNNRLNQLTRVLDGLKEWMDRAGVR